MSDTKSAPRERLIEAMIAVMGRRGYAGASVARVIEQAGVSRATFYAHFADREECFLAAYRQLAQGLEEELEGLERHADPATWRREAVAALLAGTEAHPAAARVVLIEGLAGGPTVRAEHARLIDKVERAAAPRLDDADGPGQCQIPARPAVAGVGNVAMIRIFRGETGRISQLLDDLLAWIDSYRAAAGESPPGGLDWAELARQAGVNPPPPERRSPEKLPRGRGALPAGEVAAEHRDRILRAVARLSREKGYADTSVADLVAAAAVTREVFYELFRNKEEAFLATQEMGLQESVANAAGAFFVGDTWPDRVWNGLEALITYVAGQPDLVYVDLVESYAAGAAAIRRSFDNRMAYTLFLEDGYRERPEAAALPRLCSEAIGGAILEVMRRQVLTGESERMLEVLPQLVYVALAPFVGPAMAMRLVSERCRARSERSPAPQPRG